MRSVAKLAEMNSDRAGGLLDDVIASDQNQLTEAMVEEAGGRDAVIAAGLKRGNHV